MTFPPPLLPLAWVIFASMVQLALTSLEQETLHSIKAPQGAKPTIGLNLWRTDLPQGFPKLLLSHVTSVDHEGSDFCAKDGILWTFQRYQAQYLTDGSTSNACPAGPGSWLLLCSELAHMGAASLLGAWTRNMQQLCYIPECPNAHCPGFRPKVLRCPRPLHMVLCYIYTQTELFPVPIFYLEGISKRVTQLTTPHFPSRWALHLVIKENFETLTQ